nr:sesquipedalian-1 [Nothobranchius furzeri]
MKINEKLISYFESSSSPVDKQGYLSKKGEIKTSYQRRWFVLKGNLLFYKDRPADRDVVGVIVLEGCTVQLCESEEHFAFSLVWSEPGLRTYKFAAEDQTSQESWIKALLSASHSYLAVLVTDMEKKYRDALGSQPADPKKHFKMPNFHSSGPNDPGAYLNPLASAQASYPSHVFRTGAPLSSSQHLQTLSRTSTKKSPKPRPNRGANMSTAGADTLEMSSFFLDTEEEFSKMHDDFGKEVKELIAVWTKKISGVEAVQEENLIDFG